MLKFALSPPKHPDFSPEPKQFSQPFGAYGRRVTRAGKLVGQAFVIGSELRDLISQRRLLLAKCLDLVAQARGLTRLVNPGSSDDGERGGDESFLKCGHGNGFGGDSSGGGGDSGFGQGGGSGNGSGESNGRGLDGIGGYDHDESARANGDAALSEEFAQALDGAADAFAGRVFGRAESLADFAQGFVLEVAEQDCRAVAVFERLHGFVEKGFDMGPVGGGGVHGVEFLGDLFADLAPRLAADHINGCAAGNLIKPRGEHSVGREAVRLASEVGEGGLGDFLRQLRGADLAERSGKDQINVAADDLGESILGVLPGISAK